MASSAIDIASLVKTLDEVSSQIHQELERRAKQVRGSVKNDQLVRVTLAGKKFPVVGHIEKVDSDSVIIKTSWSTVKYSVANIERIEVKQNGRFKLLQAF